MSFANGEPRKDSTDSEAFIRYVQVDKTLNNKTLLKTLGQKSCPF